MKTSQETGKRVSWLSWLVRGLLSAVYVFLLFWFELPPINLRSPGFWWFVILVLVGVTIILSVGRGSHTAVSSKKKRRADLLEISADAVVEWGQQASWTTRVVAIACAVILAFLLLGSLLFSPFFAASQYHDLIQSEDGEFQEDVSEISWSQIPVVDRDSATRLGARKLGEISDLVSQFEVAEDYTQINYHGVPTRVTPLVYGDIIKWFNNHDEGIPAYISVNMVTQETTLNWIEGGMSYSESEYFMHNIHRYLRFQYPTLLFDSLSFEIDEEGTPYWVASTYTYRIGIFSGKDANGAVLVNAVTGEHHYYELEEIPSWVDQVYDATMVMEQLEYYGKYSSGFWNSIFGQSGVLSPTDGYNYLAIGDDVWLYTGMTSVGNDESNVGFVLVNLRTKETKYYSVPGAEEYSAMSSAEGQVQNLSYNATFPILLNIGDRPTYFMSLKDNAGLVKMYAFVDVEQYQIVGTGTTVNAACETYLAKLAENDIAYTDNDQLQSGETETISGVVTDISSAVVGGNTVYYFRLEGDENIYTADVNLSTALPFWKVGDTVTFTVATDSAAVKSILS